MEGLLQRHPKHQSKWSFHSISHKRKAAVLSLSAALSLLQTNPRAPDFLIQGVCVNRPLSQLKEDILQLENAQDMKGMHTAQEEVNQNNSNRVCWAMLSLEEALSSLEAGTPPSPSVEDLQCIVHMCRKERNLVHALRLHAQMHKNGLDAHTSLGNYLVLTLVEVGSMVHAQQVFDRLVHPNEHSWNFLITGYMKYGEPQHSLTLYQKMQEDDSLHPSGHTFVAILKACAQLKDIERGRQIHAEIAREGLLERDIFAGSALVDMYAKCGFLAKAQEVFDMLPVRNTVLWTALIAGYAEHGLGEEALDCFEQMQHAGVSPDAVTYVCSLKACGSIGAKDMGRDIHAEIAKKGLDRDLLLGNTLVDMYAKCGLLAKAQEVFDNLPILTVVSWTALIAGYAEHGCGEEALDRFDHMQHKGIPPDDVTLVCALKACGSIGATDKGREIHAEIVIKGLERDLVVGSTLVDMYAKCGLLAEAHEVSSKLLVRTMVSWTALIAGYAEHGRGEEALKCFEHMQHEGISPDAATFICSLKACGSIKAIDNGQEIHNEIAKQGIEKDIFVGNTLVDMYAKCGLLVEAQLVIDKLLVRTVVSWNALIAGYAEHSCSEEALDCYEKMQNEGVSLDDVTFSCSLKACGSIGATDKGRDIHGEIAKKGLEKDLFVGNTLVDMYAKCGCFAEAQEVFDKLLVRDKVSWNLLIAVYAQLGESESAFYSFDRMIEEGIKPNLVTFLSVLNACSHAGLLDRGQLYFEAMDKNYGLNPTIEHHTCMVDLLGRAGHIDKALSMIKKMPFHPSIVVWLSVLAACRKWGNVNLGRQAFEHAVRLDEKDTAAYVCMSNIYADAGMQEEANKVEAMRVEKQA